MIDRPEYLKFLNEWKDKQIIKVITGACVKIGLNQEKPNK